MAALNLNRFTKTTQLNQNSLANTVQTINFTYSDIKLDLEIGDITTNFPVGQKKNLVDAVGLYDIASIKNSIENAFNTIPGQKLLNPQYGLNLLKYLFQPISENTGRSIAESIIEGLPLQEPRININNLKVVGNTETQTYNITFVMVFPNINNQEVSFSGKLNTDGFKFR